MNTIGKILVILNFLFAVILGVFLVLHFAVQTQWKDAYTDLKDQLAVMKKGRYADFYATQKVLAENKNLTLELDKLRNDLNDQKAIRGTDDAKYGIAMKELESKLDDAAVSLKEALAAKQRLTNEITLLGKSIDDRQKQIVKLEGDVKMYQVKAVGNEARARTLQTQNEGLLEQLRDVTRELALLKSGVNPDTIAIRNPNEPNPPATLVNGKIERVDATDGTLIQISIGSDHGVNKNHTLDVYRTVPEPKYLGMIRIVESYQQKSVARLVATNAAARNQLRPDDLVTSKITK